MLTITASELRAGMKAAKMREEDYSMLDKVYHWQSIFGAGSQHTVSDLPRLITPELAKVRAKFLKEEIGEYLEANEAKDLVEVLDALVDLQFFLLGQVVIHGLQEVYLDAFEIVYQSNMSKLGEDGQPILREDGKILKGPGYWKPTAKLTKLLFGKAYRGGNREGAENPTQECTDNSSPGLNN